MAITLRTFPNGLIAPYIDGGLYQYLSNDFDAFVNINTVPVTISNNVLTITQSTAIVGGRVISFTQTAITASPTVTSGVGRLVLSITGANGTPAAEILQEYASTASGFRSLTKGTINRFTSQNTYEAEICTFKVSSSNISNLVMSMHYGMYGQPHNVIRFVHEGSLSGASAGWQQPLTRNTTEILCGTQFASNIGNYQFQLPKGGYRIDVIGRFSGQASGHYGVGMGIGSNLIEDFTHTVQSSYSGIYNRIGVSGLLVLDAATTVNPVMYTSFANVSAARLETIIEKLW